ncbi:hypothetical protein PIROE2DRAFT_9576 [Piromyces sp. E2]|nr:hypothetical protein PIROE2DRAFT_9576 [Piromyces sp. E2]|eukprot:OUM63835.1 hypothetical protein PIROE2DRAFT_9576 [Piromyces sp. E2]
MFERIDTERKGIIIVIPVTILSIFGFTVLFSSYCFGYVFDLFDPVAKTFNFTCDLFFGEIEVRKVDDPFDIKIIQLFLSLLLACYGFVKTFNYDYNLFFGGIVGTFEDTWYYIKEFWDFNYNSFFAYLLEIEDRRVDEPFDINIIQIFISFILACYGSIIGTIVVSVLWFIKLIPLIYRLYRLLIDLIFDFSPIEIFIYSLFFILGFCCIPALGVASILLYIGYALFGGILCAIEGYKYNFLRGLISIWDSIRNVDGFTNEFIFKKEYSCFPDFSNTFKTIKPKKFKDTKSESSKKNNESKPEKNKEDNSEKKEDEADIAQELLV